MNKIIYYLLSIVSIYNLKISTGPQYLDPLFKPAVVAILVFDND